MPFTASHSGNDYHAPSNDSEEGPELDEPDQSSVHSDEDSIPVGKKEAEPSIQEDSYGSICKHF